MNVEHVNFFQEADQHAAALKAEEEKRSERTERNKRKKMVSLNRTVSKNDCGCFCHTLCTTGLFGVLFFSVKKKRSD